MPSKKALMLPSSAMVTAAFFPCKSTTKLSSTPHAEAMSLAYEERKSKSFSAGSPETARFTTSRVMRALASCRHPVPTHGVQSSSHSAPAECVHLPSGQMLHVVASNSPFHVPAGQAEQAEAPFTVL